MRIQKSALVPYTPEMMFALVADIERYPEFLPWCRSVQVRSRELDAVVVNVEFSYHGVRQTFTTRNQMTPPHTLNISLVSGPFRQLTGHWRFIPLDTGCKISLDMTFEFAGPLLSFLFGPVFERVANTLVDAFVQRARQLAPAPVTHEPTAL